MDAQSAALFANPRVKLAGYQEHEQEIRDACQIIFGQVLTPEDFVELIAAPDGSELSITATRAESDIELRLGYSWFSGTCDYLLYLDPKSGKRVVEFDNIALLTEAPEFLETRLFARQVASFRKFEIDEIRLWAEGYANHPGGIGGYYVWPRLGFSMDLTGFGARLAKSGLTAVDTTLDLFSQEGGAEWWRSNGSDGNAFFDLGENSLCVLALRSYLKERGINVDE